MFELLAALPKEFIVFVIAMVPLIELRGAIPIGLSLGLAPLPTFVWAIAGNVVPIPFLLLLLNPIRRLASKWPVVGPVLQWASKRAHKRKAAIERHGFWGLLTFVGVPLPGTGAWSGALIAVILEMPVLKASAAIGLGVLMAGVLIQMLSLLGLMVLR